jgi:prepilin-type N-terminal cleavage/methylation domain-containing protein
MTFHVYNDFIFIDYLKMKCLRTKLQPSGFTLIELMMTVLVVCILATVGITQFTDFGKDARNAVTMEKIMALKAAINGDPHFYSAGEYSKPGYESHCHAPPTTLTDLITMPGAGTCSAVYNPFTKTGWRGPYVSSTDSSWNQDAWGTAFEYFVAGPPARTIRSCGQDKICGNADDLSVTF